MDLTPQAEKSKSTNPLYLDNEFDIQLEGESPVEIPQVLSEGFWSRFFPFGFCYELKQLIKLAVPIALTSLISFLFGPISAIFCGQYNKDALATVGLAVSVFNVTGMAVATGILTACDTLFAQTYGGRHKQRMGIQLQRAVVIMTLICLPCWAVHLCIEPILLALHQNPMIAKTVGKYLVYMMPGLFFAAMGQILQKYIQTQNRVYPPLIIGILSNSLNALLHYIFLFVLDIGVLGSAISQSISYLMQPIAYLIYLVSSKLYKETWDGYRHEMWLDWGKWFRLAIPGMMMVGLEWWIFEIGSLVAGALGEIELGSQTIIFQLESLAFTLLPFGFGIATSIRVGHFLGARSTVGPKSTTNVALITAWSLSVIYILCFIFLRNQLPKIFSQDEEIIGLTSRILPILACFQLFDATVGVCGGVVRGTGLQIVGACICLIGLYCIGLPLGIVFIYVIDLGLPGLWWGLTIGTFTQAAIYFTICMRMNWAKQVELTIKRTAIGDQKQSAQDNENTALINTTNEDLNDVYGTCPQLEQSSHKPAKSCSKVMMTNRILLFLGFLVPFIASICCRKLLRWVDYFGAYCVFPNGTFAQAPTPRPGGLEPILPTNCTYIVP